MNKVKPQVALFCSIIGVDNNRLEQLAFDKCHSFDLTYDYFQVSHKLFFERFYSHVMLHISTNIQSLTVDIRHLPDIITFAEKSNGILHNLKHLKIVYTVIHVKTGGPCTLGKLLVDILF